MERLGRWCTRPKVPIPDKIIPAVGRRMLNSLPESPDAHPDDERMYNKLGEALTFLSETGSQKDAQRAITALALLREVSPSRVRAGRSPAVIGMGDQMVCIDNSSQPVTGGNLAWISVDFGGNLPLGWPNSEIVILGRKERTQSVRGTEFGRGL